MARPLKDIDPRQVELLAECGCTLNEIAAKLGCHADTIRDRFSESVQKGREAGKTDLRQTQWRVAKSGNVAMLIWLGKQYLGQRDNLDINKLQPEQALAILASETGGDREEGRS